jgi:hypothetical protein
MYTPNDEDGIYSNPEIPLPDDEQDLVEFVLIHPAICGEIVDRYLKESGFVLALPPTRQVPAVTFSPN